MNARRIVSAMLSLGVLASCGIPPESSPRPVDPPRGPFQALASRSPATGTTSGTVPEQLFLVRDGRLVMVTRHVVREPTVDSLMVDLLDGPTASEREAGFTSALLGGRVVAQVRLIDSRAVVELAVVIEGAGRNDEMLGYAQLVCTLTARPEIHGVTFTRDGQPIAVPRDDGSLSVGPLTTADYRQLIAPQ